MSEKKFCHKSEILPINICKPQSKMRTDQNSSQYTSTGSNLSSHNLNNISADAMIKNIFDSKLTPSGQKKVLFPSNSNMQGSFVNEKEAASSIHSIGLPPTHKSVSLPSWLDDSTLLPEIYSKAFSLVQEDEKWADTNRASLLLLQTKVPPPVLGIFWEHVNRTQPGRLLVSEFFALLAMIACFQNGIPCQRLEDLRNLPHPVLPIIAHPALSTLTESSTKLYNNVPLKPKEIHATSDSSINLRVDASPPSVNLPPSITSANDQHSMKFPSGNSTPNVQQLCGETSIKYPSSITPSIQQPDELVSMKFTSGINVPNDQQRCTVFSVMLPSGVASGSDQQSSVVKESSVDSNYIISESQFLKSGIENSSLSDSDDFNDFQSAPLSNIYSEPEAPYISNSLSQSKFNNTLNEESTETDKYSVFREIIKQSNNVVIEHPSNLVSDDDFGEFCSERCLEQPQEDNKHDLNYHYPQNHSLLLNESTTNSVFMPPLLEFESTVKETQNDGNYSEDDEFGNFVTSVPAPVESLEKNVISAFDTLSFDAEDCNSKFGELQSSSSVCHLSGHNEGFISRGQLNDVSEGNECIVSSNAAIKHYDVINENLEVDSRDQHSSLWMKCLNSCSKIMEEALNLVQDFNRDPSLLDKIFTTSQMNEYVLSLNEVRKISERISASNKRGYSLSSIEELSDRISHSWLSLLIFIPEHLRKIICESKVSEKSTSPGNGYCSVCLEKSQMDLSYGGSSYHAPCANLWLNMVDLTLPSSMTFKITSV